MGQPILLALVVGTVVSGAAPGPPPPQLERHRERPEERFSGAAPPARSPIASAATLEAFEILQVNVDASGANIRGDAANEPSLAIDPTAPNRMVIGWRQFDTIESNFRQAGWGYSHDGGRTWTVPGVIEPGVFRSDPVLAADAGGVFYYMSLDLEMGYSCDLFVSRDGGVSWDEGHFAFGGDKEWMAVDRTEGLGAGHVYHTWNWFLSCCQDLTCCEMPGAFTRSVDGGVTWSDPVALPHDVFWGTIAVGPEGEVYVAGRDSVDANVVLRSTSARDASRTPQFEVTSVVELGGVLAPRGGPEPNPSGLLGHLWVATDHGSGPRRGRVYLLASVDPPGPDPRDVMFAASADGGRTWTAPVRVNDDPADPDHWQWFGTMSVAPNGRIDAIWNDTRHRGQVNISELYYSASTDGGRTWSENVALSPAFDSWVGWPQQAKIGDYYHMISDDVGAHLAWAATFNGEQDVYALRIGDYDCNGNGVGDSEDLAGGASGDCNENGLPDECEIAAGTVADGDRNGVPDECEACPADIDGDGLVGVPDLTALIGAWGVCRGCPADVTGDGEVDVQDLIEVVLGWGACAR